MSGVEAWLLVLARDDQWSRMLQTAIAQIPYTAQRLQYPLVKEYTLKSYSGSYDNLRLSSVIKGYWSLWVEAMLERRIPKP